jgi:cell division septation protein DedD
MWEVSERISFGCNLAINLEEQSPISRRGRMLTMLDNGPSKHQLRVIWLQVAVSTFVVVGPLLAMAAGVKYLFSPFSQVPALQVWRPPVTAQQLSGSAPEHSDMRAERTGARMEGHDIRRDDDSATPVDTGQRALGNSDRLSLTDIEAAAATVDVSAGVEEAPVPRRRISSLTLSGAAPQTTEATLTPQSQPSGPVPHEAPHLTPGSNQTESWVVQLSAQRTEAEARSAFRAAQTKYPVLEGYQLLIRKKDQGERGVFYAAQLGPLPRNDANQLCSRLKNAGASCFIQRN